MEEQKSPQPKGKIPPTNLSQKKKRKKERGKKKREKEKREKERKAGGGRGRGRQEIKALETKKGKQPQPQKGPGKGETIARKLMGGELQNQGRKGAKLVGNVGKGPQLNIPSKRMDLRMITEKNTEKVTYRGAGMSRPGTGRKSGTKPRDVHH